MNEQERNVFLFVLWEEARDREEEILRDLGEHFTVLKRFEIAWPQRAFLLHLEAFYGHPSPIWRAKAHRDGTGSFLVVLVEDTHPSFDWRKSMGGAKEWVDVNVYEAKKRYRKLLHSKDRVHSSVTVAETRHNFCLLTGVTLADYLASARLDGEQERRVSALPRYRGWTSLKQLFSILGECMPYVVLRNAAELDAPVKGEHPDIDLLVSSAETFAAVTGAEKMSPKPYRAGYLLAVGDKTYKFDLRQPGDGYYDPAFAADILKRAVVVDGLSVPCPEDQFFSLLYHALLQKKEISPDYADYFAKTIREGTVTVSSSADLKASLSEWLCRKGYSYCRPLDPKVPFNTENILNKPGVKILPRSHAHLFSFAFTPSRLRIHLFPETGLPNIFRFQLRLGGIFKIDICLGEVKEIET